MQNKIATTGELQGELRQLIDYASSHRPSRAVLASKLRELGTRVAGASQFEQYIQLAADDVKDLRKSDVYRVLEQAKSAKELAKLIQYIGEKNPGLKGTLEEDAADLRDEKGWGKTASTPLDKAVELARLYSGSSLGMNVRDAQKLYNRLQKACQSIAKAKDMDATDVFEQVMNRAKQLGPMQARPGQHY